MAAINSYLNGLDKLLLSQAGCQEELNSIYDIDNKKNYNNSIIKYRL